MKNIKAQNQKIEALVRIREGLQNMMTHRIVRALLEQNTLDLAYATGFDTRTVECIWK